MEDGTRNMAIWLDTVCLFCHWKVGEFVCAFHVVGLEAGVESVLGPSATA
jgi:hypothetical protein